MASRRDVLKSFPACVAGVGLLSEGAFASEAVARISLSPIKDKYSPLDRVIVEGLGAHADVVVRDGRGAEYFRGQNGKKLEFTVGGALGTHCLTAVDAQERFIGSVSFYVDCETQIEDEGGYYARLLEMLRWTMDTWEGDAPVRAARFDGKSYYMFVGWLRDHTHTMKGQKYFWPQLKPALDLYADTQREDGMVFDNIYHRAPKDYNYWDWILSEGKFLRVSNDRLWEMRRQPVEADVEYLFIEALYFTWKATGDDEWMASRLDHAMKAVTYSTSDAYRWSEKYRLIKRAYTIDTWDFVPEVDQVRGQNQLVDLKTTKFGVMFGDNTGMIACCRYLSEMLMHAHRKEEAARFGSLAGDLQRDLDAVAWNGEFYRHHVGEDPSFVRDLGVDESKQVSLSNSYSLNRGITHEQAVAIIRTYQRIRQEMPKSSPGEFFAIYPPYQRGFEKDNQLWEYMNAGVLSIVAGELAHGAFEHGFEEYGVDILRRQKEIAEKHDGFLPVVLRGKAPEEPQRKFETVSLHDFVNVDFGPGASGVIGWLDEKGNNLENMPVGRQVFEGVPFDIVDPATNAHRGCLGLTWGREGYTSTVRVPVARQCSSIYLLHAASKVNSMYGAMRLHYQTGESATIYIDGSTLGSWWEPRDCDRARVAWHGPNELFGNVGMYVAGYNNPHPDRIIEAIEFEPLHNEVKWMIAGVTVSDAPVFFMPKTDVSFGIPDSWGAAAVVYALVEGLAGVKDSGVGFDKVEFSPRWAAAGVTETQTTIRYAASRGYVHYRYKYDAGRHSMTFDLTGNASEFVVNVLLPAGVSARAVRLDGREISCKHLRIDQSSYVHCSVPGGVRRLEIVLNI